MKVKPFKFKKMMTSLSKGQSKKPKGRSKQSLKKSTPKKSVRAKTSSDDSFDIAKLILKDHKMIKELILKLKSPDLTMTKINPYFEEFKALLSAHAKAEEKSLYEHMKEYNDLKVESIEGVVEHKLADMLMVEIDSYKNDENEWLARVKVLAELVDHHVIEEEKEVIKAVKRVLSLSEREVIGKEYRQFLSQINFERDKNLKQDSPTKMRGQHV